MQRLPIHSTKYDGSPHWRYLSFLLEETADGWLTFAPAGLRIQAHKGIWLNGYPFLRWHWRDRWWDALLVFQGDGRWLKWYCNIVTPPRLEGGALRFHDLDLDVVWHHERGLELVDVDEFEQNAARMAYPAALVQRARDSAAHLQQLIQQGAWRFGEEPRALRYEQELARWPALLT